MHGANVHMYVHVWSVLDPNNVSKWLAEDVCILRGIIRNKTLAPGRRFGNSSGDNAGNQEPA